MLRNLKPIVAINIVKRTLFIKNKDIKPCSSCIHFIEHTPNYPYEDSPNDEKYGKCKMFGEQNLVSGQVHHDYAVWCRQDNNKCGIIGKHYIDATHYKELIKK